MAEYRRFIRPGAPALAGLATLAGAPAKTENHSPEARRWRERWHEVRRIIVTKRGLDESASAREASAWVLTEWMNEQKEEQPDINICGHCGQRFTNDNRNPGLPFLNGEDGGHVWIHQDCHREWFNACEARAKATLQSYGIEIHD